MVKTRWPRRKSATGPRGATGTGSDVSQELCRSRRDGTGGDGWPHRMMTW